MAHELIRLTKLLEVRSVIAPAYTREAVKNYPNKIIQFFNQNILENDTPESFAHFDWKLHRILTVYSDNFIYPLLLNSFSSFYQDMAQLYFKNSKLDPPLNHIMKNYLILLARKIIPKQKK